jgi:hypothetical protein
MWFKLSITQPLASEKFSSFIWDLFMCFMGSICIDLDSHFSTHQSRQ